VTCDIKSQTRDELEARFKDWGQPAYRAGQVFGLALCPAGDGLGDDDKSAQTPARTTPSRTSLSNRLNWSASRALTHHSKVPLRLSDQALIESVLIPANPASMAYASDRTPSAFPLRLAAPMVANSAPADWTLETKSPRRRIVEQVLAVER